MMHNLKKPPKQPTTDKKQKWWQVKKKKAQYEIPTIPFANQAGKEGDTNVYKDKTYYYYSGEHKVGHWVTHKPESCRSKKKGAKNGKKKNSKQDS